MRTLARLPGPRITPALIRMFSSIRRPSSRSTRWIRARTSASRAGPRISGRLEVPVSGAGLPTIPSSISSTTAQPFGFINTTNGVDLKTGRLQYVPEKATRMGEVVRYSCPAAPGAKDWQPSAYSPRTGLVYIPHQNLCMDEEGVEANYIAGTPYVGTNVKMYAGPGGHRGLFDAWDPVGQHVVWSIKEDLPVWSGALVTAGPGAHF